MLLGRERRPAPRAGVESLLVVDGPHIQVRGNLLPSSHAILPSGEGPPIRICHVSAEFTSQAALISMIEIEAMYLLSIFH